MKRTLGMLMALCGLLLAGQSSSYAGSKLGSKKKLGVSDEESQTRKNKTRLGLSQEERKKTYTGFSGSAEKVDRTRYSVVRVKTKGKKKIDVWVVLKKDRIQLRNYGKATTGLKKMIQNRSVNALKISIKGRDKAMRYAEQYMEKLPETKRGQVSLVTKAGKMTKAEEIVPVNEEE